MKAELGIDEAASEDNARVRLEAATESLPDAPWMRARLAPLVGLAGEGGEREEVFAAWLGFLEACASRNPLASSSKTSTGPTRRCSRSSDTSPRVIRELCMLIICTSRPELLETHPEWAGGLTNATSLSLRPLKGEELRPLVESLLGATVTEAERWNTVVERCGGNPLYAQEYARLLDEQRGSSVTHLEMPETIQAVITARIDTLSDARKSLSRRFGRRKSVLGSRARLDQRRRRNSESERRCTSSYARASCISRSSAFPGDDEYVFWHDVIREVAYNQMPRAERADRHRRVAAWIEGTAGDRLAGRAELIAHHWRRALELLTALGENDLETVRQSAVRWLAVAGEQTMGLDREGTARPPRTGPRPGATAKRRNRAPSEQSRRVRGSGRRDRACLRPRRPGSGGR